MAKLSSIRDALEKEAEGAIEYNYLRDTLEQAEAQYSLDSVLYAGSGRDISPRVLEGMTVYLDQEREDLETISSEGGQAVRGDIDNPPLSDFDALLVNNYDGDITELAEEVLNPDGIAICDKRAEGIHRSHKWELDSFARHGRELEDAGSYDSPGEIEVATVPRDMFIYRRIDQKFVSN